MPDANDAPAIQSALARDLIAQEVRHVLAATASYPNAVREAYYIHRVLPHFPGKMLPGHLRSISQVCGYASGLGWMIASKVLGVAAGRDYSFFTDKPLPPRSVAYPHYEPRFNYGGWVRLFRSKAAAMPENSRFFDEYAAYLLSGITYDKDGESEMEAKGIYGIEPYAPITLQTIKEGLKSLGYCEAPWLVAIWHPGSGWVVQGNASRFLDGEGKLDARTADLLNRPYADQIPGMDADMEWIPGTGPIMGLRAVMEGTELALRKGYRLDMVVKPVDRLDSWEDGVPGFAETPLMGVLIHGPVGSFLPAFQSTQQGAIRLSGLADDTLPHFREITGIDPTKDLSGKDVDMLSLMGIPVFGRVTTLTAASALMETK